MYTVIAALISAGAAILVCVLQGNANHKKLVAELEKHDAVHDERLKQLKETVDKHNQVIERTFRLEQDTSLLNEKIKVANHRIEDLERITKEGKTA